MCDRVWQREASCISARSVKPKAVALRETANRLAEDIILAWP